VRRRRSDLVQPREEKPEDRRPVRLAVADDEIDRRRIPTQPAKILDLWTIRNGKAVELWIAYFEPQALLDKLSVAHRLKS
jgi:hypothetical protein